MSYGHARIIAGENPGAAVEKDHSDWYQELFRPSVTAGLLKPADLASYRNDQVYIRNSYHVPLRVQAVRESMPVFFDLLRQETDPAVRVILGHVVFVHIHPYMGGNAQAVSSSRFQDFGNGCQRQRIGRKRNVAGIDLHMNDMIHSCQLRHTVADNPIALAVHHVGPD
ncbi:MAG: hypothetical protein GYB33_06765 [Gammaproteobacteria bacterium]|nr:hypothetical protein [Gammaproteobacteria bacterium]